MIKLKFKQILVLGVILLAVASLAQAQNVSFIDDTLVCLPEGSPIKLRWVVPPSAEPNFSAVSFLRKNPNFSFSIDDEESVWLGFADQMLCLNKQFGFRLSEPFLQMIHLDNGAMAFSTMLEVGFAHSDALSEPGPDELPVLPFQAFARFPETYAKILPFAFDSLIAVAEKNGKTTAYLLESDKGEGGYHPSAVRAWKKLFSIDSAIGAMASIPGKVYGKLWFAIDNLIYLFDGVDHNFGVRARLPAGEKIVQLAASRDQIFYASEKHVGVIGITNHQVILQTPFPRIYSRNGKLFVLLTGCMGVIEVQNISSLAKILN